MSEKARIFYSSILKQTNTQLQIISLLVSALNDIHLKALVDALIRFYKDHKKDKLKELDYFGMSGKPDSKWVILDFNNLLIHVMDKEIRDAYEFDNLFADYENYRYH